jgi:hypothetical protein
MTTLAIGLVLAGWPASALAQDTQSAAAEALFGKGRSLMAASRFPEACEAFEAANRIEPGAGVLIALGECREKNGQLASAWAAYRQAQGRAKDPRKREFLLTAVRAVEQRLSYLTITVEAGVVVDGQVITSNGAPLEQALWNLPVPVDGGDATVIARAPGHEDWATTVTVPATHGKVSIAVPRLVASKAIEPEVGEAGVEPTVTSPLVEPPAVARTMPTLVPRGEPKVIDELPRDGMPGTFTRRRKLALGVGGGGAVAFVVAGVLWRQARGLEHDAFAACPDPSTPCAGAAAADALVVRARSRALLANVGIGIGAVAVAGAAVLWFTGTPAAPRRAAVIPEVQAGYAGLDVTGRF